ncbi:putative Mn2+ efflux pump MntP [Ruminiclostridium sufflavum DSM 19573]|uniref:Putative manganese efflux pump MntP n=1 Tax=Ruminiclostridium sufflavum DSM 19573 TaxID=1121337 RepID=A0A318XP09_9FIRM|nr:manganese efflux pump MntP family protein [Ruminiclostridium sufflavum]PYG88765.1 putative Mn2+ efflux pump MntP [Ruminiclostridium sufflavum DSM 19573]
MGIWELILLAAGLSMDAAAVSISNSLCIRRVGIKNVLQMALMFALFQGIMPLIGYFAANAFSDIINQFDHWIAFVLLAIIGGRMLHEASAKEDKKDCELFSMTFKLLFIQAIATSIDALAVGVSLSALNVNIYYSISIISIVTFVSCTVAVVIAKRFGTLLGKRAGIVGGIILIAIGLKIFIEHMFFQ